MHTPTQLITGKEVVVQTEDNEEVPAWAIVLLILFGVGMYKQHSGTATIDLGAPYSTYVRL